MSSDTDRPAPIPAEIVAYYSTTGVEAARLSRGRGRLERARTQELLERYLPPAPAVILDVGGGPGVYACWLAQRGYTVHLIDAVPLHVEEARLASSQQPDHPLASSAVGDARQLDWPDESVDAVLLLGPLYHLTEPTDRSAALREARRVLRPGGLVLAVGIARFATALYGLFQDCLDEPGYLDIMARDLADGQHRGRSEPPLNFTTAYLHRPEELATEFAEAGLCHETTLAIEGVGWLLQDLDQQWADPDHRQRLLDLLRTLEAEPTMLGASSHIMAVGRRRVTPQVARSAAWCGDGPAREATRLQRVQEVGDELADASRLAVYVRVEPVPDVRHEDEGAALQQGVRPTCFGCR